MEGKLKNAIQYCQNCIYPLHCKGNVFAETMKVAYSWNRFVIPVAYTNPELFSWNCGVDVTIMMSSAQKGFHYPSETTVEVIFRGLNFSSMKAMRLTGFPALLELLPVSSFPEYVPFRGQLMFGCE